MKIHRGCMMGVFDESELERENLKIWSVFSRMEATRGNDEELKDVVEVPQKSHSNTISYHCEWSEWF